MADGAEPRGTRWAWLGAETLVGILAGIVAGVVTSAVLLLVTPGLSEWFVTQPTCDAPRDLVLVPLASSDATASSHLAVDPSAKDPQHGHPATDAIDSNAGTAWVEGADGYGVGEYLEFTLPPTTDLQMVCVVNGYAKTLDLYHLNSRARQLEVTTDAGVKVAVLPGGTDASFQRFQQLALVPGQTGSVRLTIRSTWVGAGNDAAADTSLSEVEFWAKK